MKSPYQSFRLLACFAVMVVPGLLSGAGNMNTSPPIAGGPVAKAAGAKPAVLVATRFDKFRVAEQKDFAVETIYNVAYTISVTLDELQPSREFYPDGPIQTDEQGNIFYIGKVLLREKVGAHAEHLIGKSGTMSLGIHPETNYVTTIQQAWTAYIRSDDPSLSTYHGPVGSAGVIVDRTGAAAESAIQAALARYDVLTRLYPPVPDDNPTGVQSPPEKTQQQVVINTTPPSVRLAAGSFTNWASKPFVQSDPPVAFLATPATVTPSKALQKMQYKFILTPASPPVINWLEIFTPRDQALPKTYVVQSWTPTTGQTESPPYTIDPLGLDADDANAVKRQPTVDGTWTIQILRPRIYMDTDGNGLIDSADGSEITAVPFAANNDDDAPTSGGPFEADFSNAQVDGPDDLKDFVPVFLDLQLHVLVMPPSDGYVYKLKQDDEAVNLVYTSLDRTNAFTFRTNTATTGYGRGLDKPAATADTQQITANGIDIFGGTTGSPGFLNVIQQGNGGVILLEARGFSSNSLFLLIEKDGATIARVELPLFLDRAGLFVDANRDGNLSIDTTDKTSAASLYGFWLNDDDDTEVEEEGSTLVPTEKDEVPGTRADHVVHQIVSKRNLEDFTRLWIRIGDVLDQLKASSSPAQLGLKWQAGYVGTPAINVYLSADTSGSASYLADATAAQTQLAGGFNNALVDVSGKQSVDTISTFIIPNGYWSSLTRTNPTLHLLFEGAGEGRGQLVPVLLDQNGTEIAQGHGVWLDLKNIKSMYERAVATTGGPRSANGIDYTIPIPSDFTGPDSNDIPHPTMGWEPNPLGYPYQPDPAETQDYFIYVHGWRWSPEVSNNRTETVFKRLWHVGFKGRLTALRWPTFYGGPDDGDDLLPGDLAGMLTYNNSEYRAWKSGESLKLYVNQLPAGFRRHVVAHSMGNIVSGSALNHGMAVCNYVLLNAAVPAMCYDEDENLRQAGFAFSTPNTDSDPGTRALAYTGHLGVLNTNVVNYFLINDRATQDVWNFNNEFARPVRFGFLGIVGKEGYAYNPTHAAGQRLYLEVKVDGVVVPGRYLIDPHEVMPYDCQSLTRTAGAEGRTDGSIDSKLDMDINFGFGTSHGAEWDRDFQATRAFYIELLRTLQIPGQP